MKTLSEKTVVKTKASLVKQLVRLRKNHDERVRAAEWARSTAIQNWFANVPTEWRQEVECAAEAVATSAHQPIADVAGFTAPMSVQCARKDGRDV